MQVIAVPIMAKKWGEVGYILRKQNNHGKTINCCQDVRHTCAALLGINPDKVGPLNVLGLTNHSVPTLVLLIEPSIRTKSS